MRGPEFVAAGTDLLFVCGLSRSAPDQRIIHALVQAANSFAVILVLAECSLVPSKVKAPQPHHDVHDNDPIDGPGMLSYFVQAATRSR